MAIRHYVLLATDGFIDLPNTGDVCTTDTTSVYVFGFIGGLYQVINNGKVEYINHDLEWDTQAKRDNLFKLKGSATIPSPSYGVRLVIISISHSSI